MAGCLSGIAKYILFFFNFLIVLCGILFIALGAILIVNESKGVQAVTDYSVGGFAVAVGVIIFLIAFFGCCGAIKENGCMLTTYAVAMVILLILQVVLGALAFVAIKNDDGEFDKIVRNATTEFFDEYFRNPSESKRKVIDEFQEAIECCGIDNYRDYASHGISEVPKSCCPGKSCNGNNYYGGCSSAFSDLLQGGFKVIGGIAIGFAVVELLGAIFACVVKNRR